jgi:hypothetical protein
MIVCGRGANRSRKYRNRSSANLVVAVHRVDHGPMTNASQTGTVSQAVDVESPYALEPDDMVAYASLVVAHFVLPAADRLEGAPSAAGRLIRPARLTPR